MSHSFRNVRRYAALRVAAGCVLVAACGGSPTSPSETGTGAQALRGTFYVAINEPGADNERCDGRSPFDAGQGRCPFKDFMSARTFRLLDGVADVRVEVRAGTYSFVNEGLSVRGVGGSDAERAVLSAYQGETVVLDGRGTLTSLVRVSGQHVAVQGLTFQNAGAYHIEVRGGRQVVLQGNRFLANRSSDALKGDDGASDVTVRDNQFTQWDSQAIDMTAVARWRIEGNEFFDPRAADANAIGAKHGSRDVVIANNRFRNTRGLSLGGTGNGQSPEQAATAIVAERNVFQNVPGFVATFYSCASCQFRNNDVEGAAGGLSLSAAASGSSSRDVVVTGNRFRDLVGAQEGPPNSFWWVADAEGRGLTAGNNLYCAAPPEDARFRYGSTFLTFAGWKQVVTSDATSEVVARSEERCGW